MTTPQDPFGRPEERPDQGQPPAWDAPQGSPPPGYGQPGWGGPAPAGPGWGQQPGWQQPGSGPPPGWGQQPAAGTNGMAIASVITAIVCCSPLGIVLGLVAKSQIRQSGQSGSGLATAGIVLGVVFTLIGLLMVLTGDFSYDFSTSP